MRNKRKQKQLKRTVSERENTRARKAAELEKARTDRAIRNIFVKAGILPKEKRF